VVHEQITSWGMRNGSYASGQDALEAIRAAQTSGDPYQFVILDYQMPEMDGAAVAATIREDPLIRDVAIVMLNWVGHWRELRGLEGAGIDACLVKPVRRSHLLKALEKAWSNKLEGAAEGRSEKQYRTSLKALKTSVTESNVRVLVAEDNIVNQKV